jgi:hypothetical protein
VEHERGVALILALLVLSFLTIIGSAFLATTTIDARISDNYKSATQSLYVAEAGIEHAREMLRSSPHSTSEMLSVSAGPDHVLSTSTYWPALLADDDQPLIPSQQLTDSSGRVTGYYYVWLRNDAGDGVGSLVDNNEVLTLVSLGQVGNARKWMEVTIQKGKFPESDADPRLRTTGGLEGLAASITRNATEVYRTAVIGDSGGPANYRVTVVDGDADIGSGTGYGILLVRGTAQVLDDFTWNGLVLIIGQGVLRSNSGAQGTINGGLFIARTRTPDGTWLDSPADVLFKITDEAEIKRANRSFPYSPIAFKER